MRIQVVTALVGVLLFGCESKQSSVDQTKQPPPAATSASPTPAPTPDPVKPASKLVDITATTSLGDVRAAFNAHKGEARFLTLLSPT